MKISRESIVSGKVNTMELNITESQIKKYQDGALIQDAFPNLDVNEREFLLTGMTPEEWEQTMTDND